MKVIILTLPEFVEGEARRIEAFLRQGIASSVHLRKPTEIGRASCRERV